jgi:hypothetical protein
VARNCFIVEESLVDSHLDILGINYSRATLDIYTVSGFLVLRPISTNVRFLCGDQEATWIHFQIATLAATGISSTPGVDSQLLSSANTSAQRLSEFPEQRLLRIQWSFLDILQLFGHTECMDQRDKVYAATCSAPAVVRQYIRPDFTKTVPDVYVDVVRYNLAQARHKLDFLGYIMYHRNSQVVEMHNSLKSILPSWVPNFSAILDISPTPKSVGNRADRNTKGAMFPAYRPLGNTSSRAFIECNKLCVVDVFVDVLRSILLEDLDDNAAMVVGREISTWAAESEYKYLQANAGTTLLKEQWYWTSYMTAATAGH